MPEQKPKRRLKNLDVQFISLVDKGANQREVIYKAANPSAPEKLVQKTIEIRKTDDDERLVYGIVYAPDEVDAHGDTATAAEIKKACHAFSEAQRLDQVDKQHDEDPKNGVIVETYLLKGEDEMFPDDPVGAWAVVIKVLDDDAWDEVKKGEITGISMQAACVAEELEETDVEKAETILGELSEAPKDIMKFFKGLMEKIMKENKKPNGSAFETVMKSLEGKSLEELEIIKKDFNGALASEEIRQAVHAIDRSNWQALHDDDVTDKAAALKTNAEQFIAYIDGLTVSKSQTTEEDEPMADEPKETTTKNESGEENKEVLAAIEKLNGNVTSISERLEKVEKAAGTSQAESGQEEPETEIKKSKGLHIVS
jgi:hypothetical protein